MASKKVQFNARIPEALARKTKMEALENNANIEDVVSHALDKYFSLPVAQRRIILADTKKIFGPKVTTQ